jgi:FKBP-type peptidyl-prolyl cis-trans isomerase
MRYVLLLCALLLAACHREQSHAPAASASAVAPADEAVPRTIDRGDGCVVEITQNGSGPVARMGDEVTLAYDAHVKDAEATVASTRGWDVPCRLRLGESGALAGLTRGIEGLSAGSKARIEVPPALGYGKDGVPGANVPADATLVFEVEILGVR